MLRSPGGTPVRELPFEEALGVIAEMAMTGILVFILFALPLFCVYFAIKAS